MVSRRTPPLHLDDEGEQEEQEEAVVVVQEAVVSAQGLASGAGGARLPPCR